MKILSYILKVLIIILAIQVHFNKIDGIHILYINVISCFIIFLICSITIFKYIKMKIK